MADSTFGPGSVLAGRFTLEDLLDENDGARFWRATDRTLARSVAVHVLPDSDPRADALLGAARSSALVSDTRLLRVLDAASADGVVYVVNEWGSGVSLDRMLVEGPLSPRQAAWVVKEVAEAITTAHRNGVAHGRLLPENVMIAESGSVKVIGFVVDAVLRSRPGADAGFGHRRVTGGGGVSPHESDVLNLGGLLYAALVGRWPGTEGSTIPPAPVEHGRPLRPRQVRAGVPRPLDAICERVLNAGSGPHLTPIETAHEIVAALGDYIGNPGAPATGSTSITSPVRQPTQQPTQLMPRPNPVGSGWDHQPAGDPDVDTGALPTTGAYPAPTSRGGIAAADPEATQAGAPPFLAPAGATQSRSRHVPPLPEPEPPERPLFADGPHAVAQAGSPVRRRSLLEEDTGSFTGEQRSTGAGNGVLPASWGPDSDPPPPPGTGSTLQRGEDVPGRTSLRLAVVLGAVLLLVVAVVLAFDLGRGGSGDQGATQGATPSSSRAAQASTPVAIAGVTDFDPQGDPAEENPDLAGLAVDGKPGTAWRTSTYYDPITDLKSGVGLLVDLGRPRRVGEVRLSLFGSPTSVKILAAPGADAAPSDTDGLSTVAAAPKAGTQAGLRLRKPVTTRWLVVWLTSLPTVPGGFQGRIAEISVRS